jgi:hypothetical protein
MRSRAPTFSKPSPATDAKKLSLLTATSVPVDAGIIRSFGDLAICTLLVRLGLGIQNRFLERNHYARHFYKKHEDFASFFKLFFN